MKKHLRTLFLAFPLVILGFLASAQTPEIRVNAVAGQTLSLGIVSEPTRAFVKTLPNNGVAVFNSTGTRFGVPGTDVIEYTPATGFLGIDSFQVEYWSPTPYPRSFLTQYIVTVAASVVVANEDYATTPLNQSIIISVLANDTASFGNLTIAAVTVVNHGTVNVSATDVTFIPEAGYVGVANFQYVVCDLVGVCDKAKVQVVVFNPLPSDESRDLQVEKNKRKEVLLNPQNFALTSPPKNGILFGTSPILYIPNVNYTGLDSVEWTSTVGTTNYSKKVHIEVLNTAAPNIYAINDEAFISKNTVAYIDVLGNDLQGPTLSGFALNTPPANGTVSIQNRQVVYTPNLRFTGVDKFRYRVFPPGYSGPAEFATVTVLVSDLPPATLDFNLEVPKNTPLVVKYPIPLSNYSFGIVNPVPSYGDALFLPNADTTIAGYPINGERLLIYNPSTNFTGTDLVRVNYCITSTGSCVALNIRIRVLDIPTPSGGWCVQNCVWPGDTDMNGRVDVADLLPIGRKHGEQGLPRPLAGNAWRGVDAPSWIGGPEVQMLKNVDANGDGMIAASDTNAIRANLGRYHTAYPAPTPPLKPLPFVLSLPFDTIFAGELYYIDIQLGTPSTHAKDAYGFSYQFNYNTSFVRAGSQRVVYPSDSWLAYGSPTLDLTHEPVTGNIQTAFTRTDGRQATGYGSVARFEFIGEEDVLGIKPGTKRLADPNQADPYSALSSENQVEVIGFADFEIGGATVDLDGGMFTLPGAKISVPVAHRPTGLALRNRDLLLLPNPVHNGETRLHLNGAEFIDHIRVINDLGQLIYEQSAASNDLSLPTSGFISGIYTVIVESEGQILRQRLVVQ